ncbi:MAG: bifunctional precorrin-2 dehydrogenase/sirohydrochlorin ferrochelatase [Magnetococcales bacterium]|nr:bifunctional precorrin-2 dehydrogenase/sirohydrochlorin ferrochelatase [Magnetococcales bacterium]
MDRVFLPLFLDMKNRACLLVGSGEELVRKGQILLSAGANLKLIAPRETPGLWPSQLQDRIHWLSETFEPQHLVGIWLVVSTHSSHPINLGIRQEAEARGIFVNVVDQPDYCSAIWPALIFRPPVTVAISTGGTGPALSGWLKQKIARELPENLEEMASWFSQWRQMIAPKLKNLEERGHFWRHLFSQGLLDRFARGDRSGADEMIRQAVIVRKKNDSMPV